MPSLNAFPSWFAELFQRLLISDLAMQLPGSPLTDDESITESDAFRLLGYASLLALSDEPREKAIAYEVCTRLVELYEGSLPQIVGAADVVLSRLGNFPGRELLRQRYSSAPGSVPGAPQLLAMERIAREVENSIAESTKPLTDFQHRLFATLGSAKSVSVSAPTSAGKSFVMGLDLVRRLSREPRPACVVYVVPSRALIREVTFNIRHHLRIAELPVPVRSVPFPITPEEAPEGAVFVLTQERLMSLLHSREGKQWITSLIVDEAQSIRDDARGVLLQSAIEAVLTRFPEADVHFASPLSKNPDFLLGIVMRRHTGASFVETISPVSQNLILVSQVIRRPTRARFHLLGDDTPLDLGIRELDFKFRDGIYTQRASFARAVTRADESTVLYANRPSDTEALAAALIQDSPPPSPDAIDPDVRELIDFIRHDVHADYPLIDCLPFGVAYHYGFMPALVRARVEDLCRRGKIRYVCCTSTLLQGVNLPARHIIIENPKRGTTPMPRRDFLNLAGRAGRLLQEFHGNVWCLRPTEWEEPSYDGELLQEIESAVDTAMEDGGTLIQRILDDKLPEKELDYGEAALGKIYCDYVRGGRDLNESPWRSDDNADTLAQTARQLAEIDVTLPTELLDANRSVRPDRLQRLYDWMRQHPEPEMLIPLRPHNEGAYERMREINRQVLNILGGVDNQSHVFYSWLAAEWIYNTPLKRIIAKRMEYFESKDIEYSVPTEIREILKTLEEAIRFKLVKYYMAYNGVLDLVLRERGETTHADSLEPFHVYLECGSSDRVALNLMALGLSRSTALALQGKVRFPRDATPEDCLGILAVSDFASHSIPALCMREINELLGNQ